MLALEPDCSRPRMQQAGSKANALLDFSTAGSSDVATAGTGTLQSFFSLPAVAPRSNTKVGACPESFRGSCLEFEVFLRFEVWSLEFRS